MISFLELLGEEPGDNAGEEVIEETALNKERVAFI